MSTECLNFKVTDEQFVWPRVGIFVNFFIFFELEGRQVVEGSSTDVKKNQPCERHPWWNKSGYFVCDTVECNKWLVLMINDVGEELWIYYDRRREQGLLCSHALRREVGQIGFPGVLTAFFMNFTCDYSVWVAIWNLFCGKEVKD